MTRAISPVQVTLEPLRTLEDHETNNNMIAQNATELHNFEKIPSLIKNVLTLRKSILLIKGY